MQQIICFLPVQNGIRFNELTWGMYKMAKKIADKHAVPMIAVVVHAGMPENQIATLPFAELYHLKLDKDCWHLADAHLEAYETVLDQLNLSSGLYLFSENALYHEVAVRLGFRRKGSIVTNVMELLHSEQPESKWIVKRSIFHDKIHEWLHFDGKIAHHYITLDQAVLYGKKVQGRAKKIEEISIRQSRKESIVFLRESTLSLADLKITEARCVIGIGRGVHGYGASSLEPIFKLAELLNAPIGGSKVADELGLIPREKRIGSSGHSIEADIYIAIGISGSSQHLAGITGVKHVIAINRDAAAPIFNRCDIGIVGDFRDAVRLLVDALESERQREKYAEHRRLG